MHIFQLSPNNPAPRKSLVRAKLSKKTRLRTFKLQKSSF